MTGAPAQRVRVVVDETPLARLVAQYLNTDCFDATVAGDGPSAAQPAGDWRRDVIVFDLGLPGLDGIEVCRQLRTFADCYVLMLTARGDEVDRLVGLSVGADDYLTKPYGPRELVARVRVLLRRPHTAGAGEGAAALVFAALRIDVADRETLLDGDPVTVTRIEFDVLAALAAQPKIVFTRQLIDAGRGDDWVGDEHQSDVRIRRLRRKLGEDADDPRFIRAVRGVGYQTGDRS
jgi:DNA-binding response OmpR family regulator